MSLLSSLKSPKVYRLRPGVTTDGYGDEVRSWDTPERALLRTATVGAPSSTETDRPTGVRLVGERVLFARVALDLDEHDRIEVDGKVWRVDGIPAIRRGLASGVTTTAQLVRPSTSKEA